MPTVPTLMPGSQVQEHVAQTPQATPSSFGAVQAEQAGQAAGAVQGLGGDLMDHGAQQQEWLNRMTVRDALAQSQNDTLNYISDNVLSKQGKDAIGTLPQAQQDMGNIQKQYSDNLSNPAQQRMFNQLYPQVFSRASNMARRHILQQTMVYNQQTLSASKAASVNEAVMDYNNPQNISDAETTIQADNNSLYKGDPDAGAVATQKEISSLHTQIANSMADTNPAQASAYIRSNKGKILGPAYDTLDKSINDKIVNQSAMKAATTLSQLDPATAVAQANQIQDPQQRQLTLDTLKTHFATQNAAQALNTANMDSNNLATVVNNPETAAMMLPSNLPPDQRSSLIQSANDRLQARQGGQPIQTDMNVYSSLINQAANDPDGFLRRPLTPYASQLSDGDWQQVLNIRSQLAGKNREQALGDVEATKAVNQTFTDYTKGFPELSTKGADGKEMPPGPDLQNRMQQINSFRDDFLNRLSKQYPDPKNRTPDNAEGILNNMLSRAVVQRGWFGSSWGQKTALQGEVDENPSMKWWTGSTPLSPGTFNGQQGYFDYNSDRTSAKVYDNNGNSIGTWPNP